MTQHKVNKKIHDFIASERVFGATQHDKAKFTIHVKHGPQTQERLN